VRWLTPAAILIGAALIATSILFIGRWQISAIGYGYKGDDASSDTDMNAVYRLDRWTGSIDYCVLGNSKEAPTAGDVVKQLYKTGKFPPFSITCVGSK
jgi:hypothetical protein